MEKLMSQNLIGNLKLLLLRLNTAVIPDRSLWTIMY